MNKKIFMWGNFILGPLSLAFGVAAIATGNPFGVVNIIFGIGLIAYWFCWKDK